MDVGNEASGRLAQVKFRAGDLSAVRDHLNWITMSNKNTKFFSKQQPQFGNDTIIFNKI